MTRPMLDKRYWTQEFAVTDGDLGRVYVSLQQGGRPQTAMELLDQVVCRKLEKESLEVDAEQRRKSEAAAEQLLRDQTARVYHQTDEYEIGDRLLVAWSSPKGRQYSVGQVVEVKATTAPHYRWLITLRFADRGERRYVAGADLSHPEARGWKLFDIRTHEGRPIEERVDEVLEHFGAVLLPHLLGRLDDDARFVRRGQSCWLAEALPALPENALDQVATYLWIREAPATTDGLLQALDLPVDEPHRWALNLALASDNRFDNAGTEDAPEWAAPLPDHLLRLTDSTLIDLSTPPDELWAQHHTLFRGPLLVEWTGNPHVLTFGGRWLLDALLAPIDDDDLDLVREYLEAEGQAVSDVEILEGLFGITPRDDAFERWRFTLSCRLSRQAKHLGVEFVGSGQAWLWALEEAPIEKPERHRRLRGTEGLPIVYVTEEQVANELVRDEEPLEEPAEEPPAEWRPSRHTWEYVLTYYDWDNGVLPYNRTARELIPPLAEGQRRAVFHFVAEQVDDQPFEVALYADPRAPWLHGLGLKDFFVGFLVPGARIWIDRTEEPGLYKIRYRPTEPQRRRLLFFEDGRIRPDVRETEIACEVDETMLLAEGRYTDIEALERLDLVDRRTAPKVLARVFELIGDYDEERDVYSACFEDVFPLLCITKPYSKAYVQRILYDRTNHPWFYRDEERGPGWFVYDPQVEHVVIRQQPEQTKELQKLDEEVGTEVKLAAKAGAEDVWAETVRLVGRELQTLDQGNPFRILNITDTMLEIEIGSTSQPRTIRREEIEAAWHHLVSRQELSRREIHSQYSEFNPAYVAAILAALPGVTYKTRPIRLFYQQIGEDRVPDPQNRTEARLLEQLATDVPAFFVFQQHPAGESEYADQIGKVYNWRQGIPGSNQIVEGARFIYYRPGEKVFFGIGRIASIEKYVGEDGQTYYNGHIAEYQAWDPPLPLTHELATKLSFVPPSRLGVGPAGIRKISQEDFDTILGAHHERRSGARAEPAQPPKPALERTRTGQLIAPDLVPPGPLFERPTSQVEEPATEQPSEEIELLQAAPRAESMAEPPHPSGSDQPPAPPASPEPPVDRLRDLRDAARAIAESVTGARLDEREVVTLFFQQGFFAALGYGTVGEDIRLEQRIARGRADVTLRSFTGRPIALLEFKRPGTDLSDHIPQLEEYAVGLMPAAAALTNGRDFWLFAVGEAGLRQPPQQFELARLNLDQARVLYQRLYRRDVDWRRLDDVRVALGRCRAEPVRVTAPDQTGGQQFLQRFALDERSPFGRLTRALAEALPLLIQRSEFTRGAYEFWRQAYARELNLRDAPASWRPLIAGSGRESLYHFMFALETAYAFLSRAMLAKAMTDAGFPHLDAVDAFERGLLGRHQHGRLRLIDHVGAAQGVFEEAGRQAFASLFASDIFDWWQDAGQLAGPSVLCESLAEAVIAVFDFDFADLSGDLLGTLYQSYFDPETRKALGEFYTPPEVVEFILDEVGYRGSQVRTQRLLDPACGSGTFLVDALRRYLAASAGHDPIATLRELVDGLRIVGFDVNPFAVLMAQANYAAQILPLYAQAIQRDPGFTLTGLPVFRTDSLRKELQEGETEEMEREMGTEYRQLGFTLRYEGGTAYIRAVLPVRTARDEFLKVDVPVPQYSQARALGLVSNVEEYFAVLRATFAAVREGATGEEVLERRFRAAGLGQARDLARYVTQAATEITRTMERLRTEYQDGRFLKTLEDLALALLLKNDFQFDYVVGNPPYVRIQNIPQLLREYWAGQYHWAAGNFDIYIPFFERAITEWLREGGRLGFICSDRFLLANYAEHLRQQLPAYTDVELLFDMRDTRVFKDALNYPAIIIVRRANVPREAGFPTARAFADPEDGPRALLAEATQLTRRVRHGERYALGEHVDAFPESRDHLRPDAWYLMPVHEREAFESFQRAATLRLEELVGTGSGSFAGYQTGSDPLLIFKLVEDRGDKLLVYPRGNEGSRFEIERQVLRRWVFGRDVERWCLNWQGWYVWFPYMKVDGQYRLIPSTEYRSRFDYAVRADYRGPFMDKDYPEGWRYVVRFERELRRREGSRFQRGRREEHLWYGAAYPRNLDLYERPKFLLQTSSLESDVAFDENGAVFQTGAGGGGVDGLLFVKDMFDPWFMLALLNSRPIDFYFKHISLVYAGGAYSYSGRFLKHLPIKLPLTTKERAVAERLSTLARKLTETKGRLRELERERTAFPQPLLPDLGAVELYPLRQLVAGTPQATNIRVEGASFQPQLDGQWALAFGRTTLRFPSEAHARVAETWLRVQGRASVRTDDLLAVHVPARLEDCRRLLELLADQEAEIQRLSDRIGAGEAEVDALVAELYGLDRQAMEVVEEFLARF